MRGRRLDAFPAAQGEGGQSGNRRTDAQWTLPTRSIGATNDGNMRIADSHDESPDKTDSSQQDQRTTDSPASGFDPPTTLSLRLQIAHFAPERGQADYRPAHEDHVSAIAWQLNDSKSELMVMPFVSEGQDERCTSPWHLNKRKELLDGELAFDMPRMFVRSALYEFGGMDKGLLAGLQRIKSGRPDQRLCVTQFDLLSLLPGSYPTSAVMSSLISSYCRRRFVAHGIFDDQHTHYLPMGLFLWLFHSNERCLDDVSDSLPGRWLSDFASRLEHRYLVSISLTDRDHVFAFRADCSTGIVLLVNPNWSSASQAGDCIRRMQRSMAAICSKAPDPDWASCKQWDIRFANYHPPQRNGATGDSAMQATQNAIDLLLLGKVTTDCHDTNELRAAFARRLANFFLPRETARWRFGHVEHDVLERQLKHK